MVTYNRKYYTIYILPYYYISDYGRVYSSYSNKILRTSIDDYGYVQVCLHLSVAINNRKRAQTTVHIARLVLGAFEPTIGSENMDAHHKDHNKFNNYLYNLEWIEKPAHSRETVGYTRSKNPEFGRGINNSMCKLTEQDVYNIAECIKSKQYSFVEIANMFNISESNIGAIAYNRLWSHLNLDIDQEDIRVSSGFTDDEIENICNFYSVSDINNKDLYPKTMDIYRDCFDKLNLNEKYDLESKRKTMSRLLYKSRKSHDRITEKYDYNYIR